MEELPSCTECEVSLPASGMGSFGAAINDSNEELSPNVAIVARNLSVHVDAAPGAATRKVALFGGGDSGANILLGCDISGSNTTCNSGAQTATIKPGTRLRIVVANLGNAPPTRVRYSWGATDAVITVARRGQTPTRRTAGCFRALNRTLQMQRSHSTK